MLYLLFHGMLPLSRRNKVHIPVIRTLPGCRHALLLHSYNRGKERHGNRQTDFILTQLLEAGLQTVSLFSCHQIISYREVSVCEHASKS